MPDCGRQPPDASRGQAMVEFALVLPALMVLMLGIFEFGRAVYTSNALTNAAREGARYGIINPTDTSGIQAHAIETAVGLSLAPASVTVTCPDGNQCTPGNRIRVLVNYDFEIATPVAGPHLALSGSATMTIQ
jgi:Flp pilus assembly protein TadG